MFLYIFSSKYVTAFLSIELYVKSVHIYYEVLTYLCILDSGLAFNSKDDGVNRVSNFRQYDIITGRPRFFPNFLLSFSIELLDRKVRLWPVM